MTNGRVNPWRARRAFPVRHAVGASILCLLLACSREDPDTVAVFQMGPSAGPNANSPSVPGPGPTGVGMPVEPVAVPDNPGAMRPTVPAPEGPAPMGLDAGGMGEPDASSDSGAPLDCSPVEWGNPGGVPNPEVVYAGDDDGTLFEQKEGMEEFGYVMQEYFFSGTSPSYTTRMVVRRPSDPAKFSGTVFAEWYNVSGGIDMAVMWADSREYFMREGHVFVGVSAQAVGANTLKNTEQIAARYAAIDHPGDTAANTIFSQAGAALRSQTETLLGPCMPVQAVLAIGQSQSSARLTSYVNNAHASDQVFDGFLLHSGGEPSSSDPGVPVFVVLTMTEGNGRLDDGPNLVKWNIAGATHNGKRVTDRGAGIASIIGLNVADVLDCINPLNEYPSYRAYNAALDWLHRWVREGERPPEGPRFQLTGSQPAVDGHGNILGGVRTPDIDVPIATYGFDNGPASAFDFISALACGLGGTTVPFSDAQLAGLYATHDDYVAQYTAAADDALSAGYLLQADYEEAVQQAQDADVP